MGFSYGTTGWPSICFNAHKNWQAGWFKDRTISIDPAAIQGVWRGKVATFVDYPFTSPGENVVIQVGQLYLQFNRAKGPNFQTREMRDQLAIVEDRPKGSELLAGLDGLNANSTFYRQDDYGPNGETLFIAVCSTSFGNDVTKPDVMFISIALDMIDCSIQFTDNPTESPIPSPSPSQIPTKKAAPTESPIPSPSPSLAPSAGRRTRPPTSVPKVEAWVEPDRGQKCDDRMDSTFFVDSTFGDRDCTWLQVTSWMTPYLCVPGLPAYDVCPETCRACYDKCEDNNSFFQFNNTVANCAWVRERHYSEWESICKARGPSMNCQETCNSCPSTIDTSSRCDDDQSTPFWVFGLGPRRCAWLSSSGKDDFRSVFCKPTNPVFHICAETCRKCFDNCDDDTTTEFVYDGHRRDCAWLASNPLRWIDACQRDDVKGACRESCENC